MIGVWPSGKKPGIRRGQVVLTFDPGYTLHLYAASRAIDPPHGIQEKYCDSPQRDELESAHWQRVIAGAGKAAAGTDWPPVFARPYFNFKDRLLLLLYKSCGGIYKTMMQLNPIQDRLEQHPVLLVSLIGFFLAEEPIMPDLERDALRFI